MTASALNTEQAPRRPFSFDTEFDDAGGVTASVAFRPTKRAYLPSEVEALTAQARLEGRQAAQAEADALRSMALADIAQAVSNAAPALAAVAQAHREQSAGLALAAARIIAGAALELYPQGPLKDALESLGAEIDSVARLVIRTHGLDEDGQAQLQALVVDAGFPALIAFRDDPSMPVAAFHLEWADGRADFDPAEAALRIEDALKAALAAEAGHAEALADAPSDKRRPV